MNTKRKLRLFIQLSMLGALSMGITSTHDAVAFAAASSISQVAEFHNRMQETADNGAITILPINRAKFWAGQRFDFEVEFPKNSTNFNVGINGEGAEKVFGKKAIITDYGTHISYRINNVTFDKIGEKRVTASASGLSGRLQAKAAYTVVQEKARRRAKNVILFIGDGMSMQAKELGRILSKGLSNGKFNDVLSMEKMPSLALVTTSGYDSIVTDSANSMSAYMTGNKSVVNAMGVYENRTKDPLDDPKVETAAEILSRSKKMSYGMVTTAAVTDATPAAVTAHTRRRGEQNYIAADFLSRRNPPKVVMGGGAQFFLPLQTPGSKRKDDRNLIQEFKDKGYQFAGTKTELNALNGDQPILGLFTMNHMNVYMDREFLPKNSKVLKGFTDQPGLLDMTKKAVSVLEKNPNGFFLMSEGGSIDKQLQPWTGSVPPMTPSNLIKPSNGRRTTPKSTMMIHLSLSLRTMPTASASAAPIRKKMARPAAKRFASTAMPSGRPSLMKTTTGIPITLIRMSPWPCSTPMPRTITKIIVSSLNRLFRQRPMPKETSLPTRNAHPKEPVLSKATCRRQPEKRANAILPTM